MSGANGASDVLGMGPPAGYTLISVITVLCVFTVSISISYLLVVAFVRDIHMHIYVVTNLLMFYFWIKLTMKMPNYLTVARSTRGWGPGWLVTRSMVRWLDLKVRQSGPRGGWLGASRGQVLAG